MSLRAATPFVAQYLKSRVILTVVVGLFYSQSNKFVTCMKLIANK